MQGVLPDASAFLVSGLPTRRWYSEAVLREGAGQRRAAVHERSGGDAATGRLPPKTRRALRLLEEHVGLRLPAEMEIELRSNIPWGKGLSSSSTDILSVLSVADAFWGTGLCSGDLYRIAAQVEPTDPCLSDDILVFYQLSGTRGATIALPPVTLIYFDAAPETCVNTLEMPDRWPVGAGQFFSSLLERLTGATAAVDYAQLFDVITRSAEYNQLRLPLPGFAELYRLAVENHAGVMVAHSGTIAGLLTRPEEAATLLPRVEALTASTVYLEHYHSTYHQTLCTVSPAR